MSIVYIAGAPTNFGLLPKQMQEWASQIADETHGDYNTTYKVSYASLPNDAMVNTRYATPKEQSTSLHNLNRVNKDLALRGSGHLQSPEIIPNVERPPGDNQVPPSAAKEPTMVSC